MAKKRPNPTRPTRPAPRTPSTPAARKAAQASSANTRLSKPTPPPARARTSIETKPNGVLAGGHPRAVAHEEIALAAFLRWERFGGDPESNWLAAERELRAGTVAR